MILTKDEEWIIEEMRKYPPGTSFEVHKLQGTGKLGRILVKESKMFKELSTVSPVSAHPRML